MESQSGQSVDPPQRWLRVESIFHGALEKQAGDERSAFVRAACEGDAVLVSEVERLLTAFNHLSDTPTEKTTPEVPFGEYQVDRELGHGGMGIVYLAHRADGEFERQVALKMVGAHLRSQFFTERFRTERQILAQLDHPNITRLLDGGVANDGSPYLVMEYVDGSPIDQFCDHRLLPIHDRIRLFLLVSSAVEYAHRNLIIHRDLKPGNILVTGEGVPKLLDFGTAKLLLTTPGDSRTTQLGILTPRYASPEQLRGEPVSTATDIYSLGILLCELLVGASPFGNSESPLASLERAGGHTTPARAASLVTAEAARLRSESQSKLTHMLSGDLSWVIAKAVESEPERRYATVRQFSDDLRRYLDHQSVLARPQTPLYRAGKFVRRNWLATGAAAAFILGLSLATAFAVHQARQARAQATRAEAVTQFLQDVIYAGEPEDVRNRTVLQAMQIASGRLPEVANQPEIELSIRAALGYVYMQNSMLPQAEKELRRAQTLALQAKNNEMLASTLLSLSDVLFDEGQVKRTYMEALEMARKDNNGLSPNLRVRILSEVGQRLGFEGHSPEALAILKQAVEIGRTQHVPTLTLVSALSLLGQYLRYENRFDEAQPVLDEALRLVSSHPSVSANLALEQLGAICVKRGDLIGGERYFRQRRELMMSLAGPDNGTTMDARSRWSALQARLGHLPEALQEMRDNMAHCRKAFAAGSLGLWFPTTTLAYILNVADQPEEALSLAKESLRCFGTSTSRDLRFAQIEAELGIALAKLHQDKQALPYLEDAFRVDSADPGFGPDDYRTLRIREYLDLVQAYSAHEESAIKSTPATK